MSVPVVHEYGPCTRYVATGPNDIPTLAGVRKPDAFVVPRDIARNAINGKVRTYNAEPKITILTFNSSEHSGRQGTRRAGPDGQPAIPRQSRPRRAH